MGYKVDKIISMTVFDKDHNPVKWFDGDEAMSIESSSETTFVGNPKIGDHVYLTGIKKYNGKKYTLEVDGFYGGEV